MSDHCDVTVAGIGEAGQVLVIHNVTRYCGGTYECVAENGVPPSVRREVNVRVQCTASWLLCRLIITATSSTHSPLLSSLSLFVCVCVRVRLSLQVCACLCVSLDMCLCFFLSVRVCVFKYVYLYLYDCLGRVFSGSVCVHVRVCVCLSRLVCDCLGLCVCLSVCVPLYFSGVVCVFLCVCVMERNIKCIHTCVFCCLYLYTTFVCLHGLSLPSATIPSYNTPLLHEYVYQCSLC